MIHYLKGLLKGVFAYLIISFFAVLIIYIFFYDKRHDRIFMQYAAGMTMWFITNAITNYCIFKYKIPWAWALIGLLFGYVSLPFLFVSLEVQREKHLK